VPCSASIGVPAAIRPCRGNSTISFEFAAAGGAGEVARSGTTFPPPAFSGIFNTSSARARLASLRMNPRSSSAEIRRCTPDLDLRSSASSFLERGRDAGLPQPLVNEGKKLMLLARQHIGLLPRNECGTCRKRYGCLSSTIPNSTSRRREIKGHTTVTPGTWIPRGSGDKKEMRG
jgi:hypothetical protein